MAWGKIALLAAACAASSGIAWKIQDGNIAEVKLVESRANAAGWQKATEMLQAEQERANRAVIGAQAEARRLREQMAGQQRQFDEAVREGGECAEQASQRLACPRPW